MHQKLVFKNINEQASPTRSANRTFFPYVNDYFIWDGIANKVDFKKYIVEERESGKLVYQSDAGDYFAVLCHTIPPDYSNFIHNMPQTMKELFDSLRNIALESADIIIDTSTCRFVNEVLQIREGRKDLFRRAPIKGTDGEIVVLTLP